MNLSNNSIGSLSLILKETKPKSNDTVLVLTVLGITVLSLYIFKLRYAASKQSV